MLVPIRQILLFFQSSLSASLLSLLTICLYGGFAHSAPKNVKACHQSHLSSPSQDYLAELKKNNLLVPMSEKYKGEPQKDYAQDSELPQLEVVVVIDKKGNPRLYSPFEKAYVDTGSYRPSSDSREISYNFTDFVIDGEGRLLLGMFLEGRYGMGVLRGHSVLARGKPVLAAGRMQISKGRIITINNHTGHYPYSIEVLMRGLEYLRLQGLDISHDQIRDYTGVLR